MRRAWLYAAVFALAACGADAAVTASDPVSTEATTALTLPLPCSSGYSTVTDFTMPPEGTTSPPAAAIAGHLARDGVYAPLQAALEAAAASDDGTLPAPGEVIATDEDGNYVFFDQLEPPAIAAYVVVKADGDRVMRLGLEEALAGFWLASYSQNC